MESSIGVLEAVIALVEGCPKAPFQKDKILVEKKTLLDMLAKLRLVIQTDGAASQSATMTQEVAPRLRKAEVDPKVFGVEGEALIRQAKEEANGMRQAADDYAKNVLDNLQIVISKMLRNLETGRERLKKYQEEDK